MSKIIAITGAAGGLGRAVARRLAADGETMILLGRTLAKIEAVAAELGERAMAVQCDVGSPDSVRQAFATIAARHPHIDGLINNAALFEPSLVADATDEHILQTITTNLTGAILATRAAIPLLRAGGHIINVSSESVEMPFPHLALYQCSKAGLERFSLSLHRELESTGVRVTIVRAGTMIGGSDAPAWDPGAMARFFEASLERGLNHMQRPASKYGSVAEIFRTLIDLPPDVHIMEVDVHARAAGS
jgi:NAD(P)-dependent dehydrogenase (short-subunit alcohol dehydrogenase family)